MYSLNDRIIQNFKILGKIGEGGMGEVFKAFDMALEREVAIKSLRPELALRGDIVDRFRVEAIALAKLNHPNITTLHSFFCLEGQFFMVMELVQGETLDKLITRLGPLPWPDATDLICQALDGLVHAHRMGIIHRDIKPANLMLTPDGILKLMDFGIARMMASTHMTKTGRLIGTLEYMSPEQVRGKEADVRSDIYSLGTIFYEILTGHVPFERGSDYEIMKAQIEDLPDPPRRFNRDIPPRLEKTILRSMSKRPVDRFSDAECFRLELEQILETTSRSSSNQKVISRVRASVIGVSLNRKSDSESNGAAAMPVTPTMQRNPWQNPFSARCESFLVYWQNYPGIIVFLLLGCVALVLLGIAVTNPYSTLTHGNPQKAEVHFQQPPAKPNQIIADERASSTSNILQSGGTGGVPRQAPSEPMQRPSIRSEEANTINGNKAASPTRSNSAKSSSPIIKTKKKKRASPVRSRGAKPPAPVRKTEEKKPDAPSSGSWSIRK